MRLHPMLSAMRRNKVGAIVIGLQMAITLAILANALFIIDQRLELSRRSTGTDEANLFSIDNEWVGTPADMAALARADAEALRALPEVQDAYVTSSYPLENGGWMQGVSIRPNQTDETSSAATYFGDEHLLPTLGVRLVAGRAFNGAEVAERGGIEGPLPPGVIVTRALAAKLFPGENPLGKMIYIEYPDRGEPIVGLVDRLAAPWTSTSYAGIYEYSVIEPFRFVDKSASYVVRAKPQHLASAMRAAQARLFELRAARILRKVGTFAEWRERDYRDDRGLATILAIVCAALVAVTAFGIVGLTSYWVAQRRRQIGIRRALGATRSAIVRHFQTENLLIAGAGAVLGVGLAVVINIWMIKSFEMARLDPTYAVVGAAAVVLLGQLATLWPALRAAAIAPALATRGA